MALNLGSPVNRSHPLNRGRVGWWIGLPNNSGGNTLFDLMNRANMGLVSAPAWFPYSTVLKGITLDGSSHYGSATVYPFATAGYATITLSASSWGNEPLLMGSQSGINDVDAFFRIEQFSGSMYLTTGDGVTATQIGGIFSPSTDTIYRIVARWSSTYHDLSVNGTTIASYGSGAHYGVLTPTTIEIGTTLNKGGEGSRRLTGRIYEASYGAGAYDVTQDYRDFQQGYRRSGQLNFYTRPAVSVPSAATSRVHVFQLGA